MAAQFESAYRKNHQNDADDTGAIWEAVTRPSMRLFAVKTEEQQSVLM